MLKNEHHEPIAPLRAFNRGLDKITKKYTGLVGFLSRRLLITGLGYLGLIAVLAFTFIKMPTGFVPNEDKGALMVEVRLPDASALQKRCHF